MASPFTARAAAFSANGNAPPQAQDVNNNNKSDCGCKILERLPRGQGLMIMLNDENTTFKSSSSSSSSNQCSKCSCLKLSPQQDTNLATIHPNIYIPTALTFYPSHLKRYSGGGSGVTVFGGYHPQLGPLVMKHGGYKDLIELVSLAKIEREVVVRGRWKVDGLLRRRERILNNNYLNEDEELDGWLETDHEHYLAVEQSSPSDDTTTIQKVSSGKKFGLSMHAIPTTKHNKKSSLSKNNNKSRPLLHKMNQTFRTLYKSLPSSSSLEQQKIKQQQLTQINDQITQIQNAMSQIQIRIPAFKMIYISPMHLREREEELVNSGQFRATMMKRRHAFKSSTINVAAVQKATTQQQGEDDDDDDDEEEEEDNTNNLAQLESMSLAIAFSVLKRGEFDELRRVWNMTINWISLGMMYTVFV